MFASLVALTVFQLQRLLPNHERHRHGDGSDLENDQRSDSVPAEVRTVAQRAG